MSVALQNLSIGSHQMSAGISVVIPCYNSSRRLPETLSHLAAQRVPEGVAWEVIVVNNASTDDTDDVAANVWHGLRSNISFRIVSQPIRGSTAAREKGFDVARYDYVLFCDDDNWLSNQYVANAFSIMHGDPSIGALGGKGSPHFEASPRDWFQDYSHYYAVGAQGISSGDITHEKGYVYGAGSLIRKEGWETLRRHGFQFLASGRRGTSLSGSEDIELCLALRLLGYRIWYDERLTFQHCLPEPRLQWPYFLRLTAGAHESGVLMVGYKHALDAASQRDVKASRLHWMSESARLLKRIGKLYGQILVAPAPQAEGDSRKVKLERHKAALRGWLKLRSRYADDVMRLVALGKKARSEAASAGTMETAPGRTGGHDSGSSSQG